MIVFPSLNGSGRRRNRATSITLLAAGFALSAASGQLLTVADALPASAARTTVSGKTTAQPVENHVVYHNKKEFAGWPANEGMWSWGDELLVAFEVAAYVEIDDDHSIDRNSHKRIVFARSLDGGKTWTAEEKPEIGSPEYLGDTSLYDQSATGHQPQPFTGSIEFTHPDFAMKLRGGTFNLSYDRGKTWSTPYTLPAFHNYVSEARTSYIVTGPSSALFFMTAGFERDGIPYARSCVLQTTDGGKSFEFLSWLGDDILDEAYSLQRPNAKKPENVFSIMPSAVQIGKDHYICVVRQRIDRKKWSDLFESVDGGKSWQKIAVLEEGSTNPVSLVTLEDGSIAALYGNRRKMPMGVSGKVSRDNGKTWSPEFALREDARKWDIGYSRAAVRADGKVVGIYYYTTDEIPENFIGATIWDAQADVQ